mmetsp:Transcript_79103/g.228753  ORF Transcript_79103/g.228753 Transcript_79103/m.228753 type:complete len:208 (-) Transcript_79103:27-650(-)
MQPPAELVGVDEAAAVAVEVAPDRLALGQSQVRLQAQNHLFELEPGQHSVPVAVEAVEELIRRVVGPRQGAGNPLQHRIRQPLGLPVAADRRRELLQAHQLVAVHIEALEDSPEGDGVRRSTVLRRNAGRHRIVELPPSDPTVVVAVEERKRVIYRYAAEVQVIRDHMQALVCGQTAERRLRHPHGRCKRKLPGHAGARKHLGWLAA